MVISLPIAPTDDAVGAWLALGHALADLPRPAPCQLDGDAFTSEDKAERQEAAAACVTACLALSACARFADAQGEVHHVWAGVDRTPMSRKAANTEAAA